MSIRLEKMIKVAIGLVKIVCPTGYTGGWREQKGTFYVSANKEVENMHITGC